MKKGTKKNVKFVLWTAGASVLGLAAWVFFDGEQKVKKAKQDLQKSGN